MNSSCHGTLATGSVTLWGNNIGSVPRYGDAGRPYRGGSFARNAIRSEARRTDLEPHAEMHLRRVAERVALGGRDEQRPSRTQWHDNLYTTVLYARVPRAEHGAPSVFQATEFLDCARTVHWTPTGGAVHWCMPASAAPPSGACRFVHATLRQRPRSGSPLVSDAKAALGRA